MRHETKHPGLTRGLLEAGIPSEADEEGCTPLMAAAQCRSLSLVAQLLSQPDVLVNAEDDVGWTALMFAALDFPEAVPLLLAAGAHPDQASLDGTTALMLACGENRLQAVGALLEAGGSPHQTSSQGVTLLMRACSIPGGNSAPLVSLLVKSGVFLDAEINTNKDIPNGLDAGPSALMMAARRQPEAMSVLLEEGADEACLRSQMPRKDVSFDPQKFDFPVDTLSRWQAWSQKRALQESIAHPVPQTPCSRFRM